MNEAIAGVDDLEPGFMTDAAFDELCEQIEWHMRELERLQAIHRSQVGKNYVMPLYVGKRK